MAVASLVARVTSFYFFPVTLFEGPKQISMDLFIWLYGLQQVVHGVRHQGHSVLMYLALVTALDVSSYEGIHVRPVVTLGRSFFGFLQAIGSSLHMTVNFLQDVGREYQG